MRPWTKRPNADLDQDRMIAPLPGLILTRLAEGIYHQLFHSYRDEFPRYFGVIFEIYVGEILEHSLCGATLLSESEIKRSYKDGKMPDYVVIDGSTAILIECKAIGYQRKALATADSTSIDQSLGRVREGLIQLHEFKDACDRRTLGLERFHACSEFKYLIVTFEPCYIVNSVPFKEVVAKALSGDLNSKGITVSPWYVLAVDQLERMQPHLAAGITLRSVIDDLLQHRSFEDVLKESVDKTGKSYRDSFLCEMDEGIWQRLNIPISYENIEDD